MFSFRLEVIRSQISLYGQEAEGVCLWRVECNGASIEGDGRSYGFGNGTEQCSLGEVRNDRVVDFEEAAFQLLALPKRLFRLLPLRDIDEGYDGAEGSTLPRYRMGPKLHRKAGAVASPKNLIVSMNTLAMLKTYVNGALLDRIWPAVCPSVVFQRMHVFPQQFGGIVISKQAHRCRITEKASTLGIATEDPLRGGIEYEPDVNVHLRRYRQIDTKSARNDWGRENSHIRSNGKAAITPCPEASGKRPNMLDPFLAECQRDADSNEFTWTGTMENNLLRGRYLYPFVLLKPARVNAHYTNCFPNISFLLSYTRSSRFQSSASITPANAELWFERVCCNASQLFGICQDTGRGSENS
jgi:hypothetical protein